MGVGGVNALAGMFGDTHGGTLLLWTGHNEVHVHVHVPPPGCDLREIELSGVTKPRGNDGCEREQESQITNPSTSIPCLGISCFGVSEGVLVCRGGAV